MVLCRQTAFHHLFFNWIGQKYYIKFLRLKNIINTAMPMHLARPRRDLSTSASNVLSVSSKMGVLILCFGVKSTLSVSGMVLVNVSESVSGKIFILEDLSFFGTLLSREWSWSLCSSIPKSSMWLKEVRDIAFNFSENIKADTDTKCYSPINLTRILWPNRSVYSITAWWNAVLLFAEINVWLVLLLLQMDHGHVKEAPLVRVHRTGKLQEKYWLVFSES